MKGVFLRALLVLCIILTLVGIGLVSYGFYKKVTTDIPNPVATIKVKDYGDIVIELYPDKAPNTVANFIRLAKRGFYNDLTFHRTIPNFMIQGGDKAGNGSGSPSLSNIMDNVKTDKTYNIPGEFIANGYTKNNLKHTKGVISMARTDYSQTSSSLTQYGYNSAGSQFFIMTDDNNSLDGLYAAFGKATDESMKVIEKISKTEVYYRESELKEGEKAPKDKDGNEIPSDKPKKAPVIESITIEDYGVDYGVPKTNDVFDYYTWLMQQYYGSGLSVQ